MEFEILFYFFKSIFYSLVIEVDVDIGEVIYIYSIFVNKIMFYIIMWYLIFVVGIFCFIC